ncbi:chemotaxis protein [Salisediminibacterium halotolerans]|uniref:chemotaxis protein n=1 Tax=Salisediminibacterium halotolerans TaxID=517425 RepID=UPI000F0EB38A|nr:chemotaxis protein [Salisediminibacterium halotolerans]RLJ74093.1 two-component system chemotaxis response regulator CheV [Actinophytocola xinjiangensis]RPE87814.1 two-component system chemotaxis response regulator CheV [Salisediminibacterium halotolerans]TWG34930.1 two-component system chemotaxis response regulator CheV [Salisediminibacterium halotolerans]GEL08239.1 chemotaxis protein CheV [Salisediminibacterium halotolerans]
MSRDEKGILLESGTNELEVIMFTVGSGTFGINVMKVREILQPVDVTLMPHMHPHVQGIIRLREEIIPVIDLAKAIGFSQPEQSSADKLIVAEMNQMKVALHVHSVSRIHRISWEQIEKTGTLGQGLDDVTIGVIKMEANMILMLDYEKIVYDILPENGMKSAAVDTSRAAKRKNKTILLAEDSSILRELLKNTLTEAGYEKLMFTQDGKEALETLDSSHDKGEIDAVITDIEMPLMDGHHLTKLLKEERGRRELPVLIFSSLITGDLYHKGERVGADAQISKPEIANLVEELDRLLAVK